MTYDVRCIITDLEFDPDDYTEDKGWSLTSQGRISKPHMFSRFVDINQAYVYLAVLNSRKNETRWHYILEEEPN